MGWPCKIKMLKSFEKRQIRYKKNEEILHFRSVRPNVQGKAVTREATREAKMKRGGMKERFDRDFRALDVNSFEGINPKIFRMCVKDSYVKLDSDKSFVGKQVE